MRLFDAHNHFHYPIIQEAGLPELLQTLEEIGLRKAVVNGTTEEDWTKVHDLAEEIDWVLPSYGVHPWNIHETSPQWESTLIRHIEEGCGIGEIGLDRGRAEASFDRQVPIFRRQLEIAADQNLPTSIHCVKAWGPLLEIFQEGPLPERGFMLHSYSGSAEMVDQLASLGAYFSFGATILYSDKTRALEAFTKVPPDRLLLETDAPNLLPPDNRIAYRLPKESANHPANITSVYQSAAERLGKPLEDVVSQIEENFERFFLK